MLYTFGGKAPQVDPTAFVSASAELIGDVIVGPRCYIGPYAVIRADASRIVLEEEVAVEDGVIIHTGGEDPVVTISRRDHPRARDRPGGQYRYGRSAQPLQ